MKHLGYCAKKMDELVTRMLSCDGGINIRNEKNFFSSNSPSVFTGAEVVQWIHENVGTVDLVESMHLSHMISAHGYIFPADDHILTIKNDSTYYRFQTKCYWLSRCQEADNTHYAIYLCKRMLQKKNRQNLAEYEVENIAKLQQMLSPTWKFVFTRAEIEAKLDKKRDKNEKKILDSQERAFWDLHRPAPGCVNTTEIDVRKQHRMQIKKLPHVIEGCPLVKGHAKESLLGQIEFLKQQLARRRYKASKAHESVISHCEMYAEFDQMLKPAESANPWLVENTEYWESDHTVSVSTQQCKYKRWAFGFHELLKDPEGQTELHKFLQKEFSAENLEFWQACTQLKSLPSSQVKARVAEIYVDYVGEGARNAINVDARVAETVKQGVVTNPSRYTFNSAEDHIFNLMKNDSYTRFIRSDHYKDHVKDMTSKKSHQSRTSFLHSASISGH